MNIQKSSFLISSVTMKSKKISVYHRVFNTVEGSIIRALKVFINDALYNLRFTHLLTYLLANFVTQNYAGRLATKRMRRQPRYYQKHLATTNKNHRSRGIKLEAVSWRTKLPS